MAAAAGLPPRERLIAEGASSRLYASRDSLGDSAALKVSRSEVYDRLLRAEADSAARYKHPALLPILEQGTDAEGRVWLLMPLLSGRTLQDWHPEASLLLASLGPVADALDFLHHEGVGHSDLKPANVLLADRGILYLGDLGLLSPLGEPSTGGTPAYLSSRRLDGEPLRWQDDLHALVVLVFENLAGRLPWVSDSGAALLRDIKRGKAHSLSEFRPELPGMLAELMADVLRGSSNASSTMGWLDAARATLQLSPLPRRLYLRPGSGLEVGESIASRESLAEWLSGRLYSSTAERVPAGWEELRSLEAHARGDIHQLRGLLDLLLKRNLLQDQLGQARFVDGAQEILSQIRSTMDIGIAPAPTSHDEWRILLSTLPMPLSISELREVLPLEEGALDALLGDLLRRGCMAKDTLGNFVGVASAAPEADSAIDQQFPVGLFDLLWKKAAMQPGARLRTLELAIASRAESLLEIPSQVDLIETIDRAPGESRLALASRIQPRSADPRVARLLGLIEVIHLVRTNAIVKAVARYWSVDTELDLPANAAMNRLLFYQLTDSGRILEAREFLGRWRARHAAEVVGTPMEIQIAARELNILGTYGAQDEAIALAESYATRFRGREGAWILQMALANLAHDRGDSLEAIIQAELALTGLQAEKGEDRMELDLLSFLAGAIVHASDRTRWAELDGLLSRAEILARRHEVPSISFRIKALKGQRLRYRGDLEQAREILVHVLRDAGQSGELERSPYLEGALFIVARDGGEYQKLLSDLPRFERASSATDRLREVLSLREDILRLRIAVGDLERSSVEVQELLSAAMEIGSKRYLGLFGALSGRLDALAGRNAEAIASLGLGVKHLQEAHALRERNEYQLELIAVDPTADPDGSLIAAVIDHEQAVGERRLLPRAWQLEARRLRLAGAIREAALALAEAFRVAETLVSPEHRWPLHLEAAELALAAGERDAARADLERAVAILHDFSLQFPDPAVRERFLARPDRRAVLERLRTLNA